MSQPVATPDHPITLIAGPTASGKSRLALERAQATGAAIINADSQQLYADLRVLSARPSPQDALAAPHHLYGAADAADAWSVGRWLRAVEALLADLDRPALIVGGTGLYFNALTKGLADIPSVPVTARDSTAAHFDATGEIAFRRELAEIDPASEAAIAPGDRQRLVRALTVARATGRSLSDWRADTTPLLAPGSYEALVIVPDREALYAACDARAAMMVEQGALDEVRALIERNLDPELPAMKAVGVRELAAHLRGESTLDEALSALRQSTRNYAKRQLTWFRNQTPDWPRHIPA